MTRLTQRTPEELAAFKAANNAAAHISTPHIAFETMPKRQTFTITWQTSLGRFGWTTIKGCQDMDEAIEIFDRDRRSDSSRVPFDATIGVIKRGGQEL